MEWQNGSVSLIFDVFGLEWRDLAGKTSYKAQETAAKAARPAFAGDEAKRFDTMLRLLKVLLVLAVLIAAIVLGYAYLGDLSPDQEDVSQPVTLDAE